MIKHAGRTDLRPWRLTFAAALFSGAAWGATPLQIGGPQILGAAPGQGVAISGEWAVVGDPIDDCLANVYRYDYTTNLWGDGAGNPGVPYQTINEPGGCSAQPIKRFGSTVSITGDFAIIGAPLAKLDQGPEKEVGGIFIYQLQDTDNDGAGDEWIEISRKEEPGVQDFSRFGASVSARLSGDGTSLLFAIGAPGYDVTTAEGVVKVDAGRVYFREFDLVTETFDPDFATFDGENAGDELGFSVTTDGSFAAIGAPGFDDPNAALTDSGAVYLLRIVENAGTTEKVVEPVLRIDNDDTSGGADGDRLGTEVSLSEQYLMAGGRDAYTFEQTPDRTAVTEVHRRQGTNFGDVSQSNGWQAYGLVQQGVDFFLAPASNSQTPTSLRNPPHAEAADATYGQDLSLSDGRLMVNGETAPTGIRREVGRAYAYTLPCGTGFDTLQPMQWHMVSLPCPPGNATVAEVFADLGTTVSNPTQVPGADVEFIIAQQNGKQWNGATSANQRLGSSDTLDQDRSYWLITRGTDLDWGMGNMPTAVSTPIDTTHANDQVAGFYSVSLPDGDAPVDTVQRPGAIVGVMLGNPFPLPIDVNNIRVECSEVSGLVDLGSAGACFRGTALYVYDRVNGDTSDGGELVYRAVAPTPGMENAIQPYEGFWMLVEPAARNNVVHLPKEK